MLPALSFAKNSSVELELIEIVTGDGPLILDVVGVVPSLV